MTEAAAGPLGDYVATDLHGHTRFSDGRTAPEDFVAFRHGRGLRVIALSDHDVLTGVPRAHAAAQVRGMTLVPAMEATSFVGFGTPQAEQWHVLAYFPPRMLADGSLWDTALHRRGLQVQARWRAFVLDWLDEVAGGRVPDNGEPILSAEERQEGADFPGLLVFIDRLRRRGGDLVQDFVRHHVRFWTDSRALFGWTPEELIDAIRADGAIDVVAHPGRYRDKDRLARVLLGATGIEVYTSRHRAEWAASFLAFAQAHGKLWTASADDHQNAPYHHPPSGTPVSTVERLLDHPVPAEWRMG